MNLQILDGLLLSDGNVSFPHKTSRNPRYQQTAHHRSFLEWVAAHLPTESRISGPHPSGKYQYYMLRSPCHEAYQDLRHKWYPGGKKHIPQNFVVDGVSMLAAFLGDGHSGQTTKAVTLGTYGFAEDEVTNILVHQLRIFGFDCVRRPRGNVAFRASAMRPFLEFIGPCPVSCYAYKWNIPSRW